MFSVTNRESNQNEFLVDSGAGTSVYQQVCLKAWEASGAGMEHRLVTGQRFTTVGSTQIVMRTRDKISVWG